MGSIIRAVSGDEFVKIAVVEGRDMVEHAREIHRCSPTATAALGRALCGASLMGNMLKEQNGTLTLRVNGGGPIGSIVCVSDSEGNVRGCCGNPAADAPTRADGKLDVGGIVGRDGTLTVSRDIGLKEPYIGSTRLVSGEIAEDLTAYFARSEQVGTACGLGVLVGTDKRVRAAGGFLVQLLPGAPEDVIGRLEENVTMMDALTTILDEDGADEVITQVLRGFSPRILSREDVCYRCYCSRERVRDALLTVGAASLEELAAAGEDAQVSCQFCEKHYAFSPAELSAMAAQAKGDKKL